MVIIETYCTWCHLLPTLYTLFIHLINNWKTFEQCLALTLTTSAKCSRLKLTDVDHKNVVDIIQKLLKFKMGYISPSRHTNVLVCPSLDGFPK